MKQVGLFGDLAEERAAPLAFLSIFGRILLAPARHFGGLGRAAGWANLDRRVLNGGGRHGYLITTLENELHHLSVDQSMHRFPIDMSDEVTSTESRLLGGATFLHMPDDVVDAIHVAVSHVDADGSKRKAIAFGRALDGDWCSQQCDRWAEVSAGGGVT